MRNLRPFLIILFAIACVVCLGFLYWDIIKANLTSPLAFLNKILVASNFLNITAVILLINTGIVLVCMVLELLINGWEQSALRRVVSYKDKSTRGDVMCWLLSVFGLYDFFVFLFSFGVFYVFSGFIQSKFYLGLGDYAPNKEVLFALIFVLGDLKHYLWHFFMHKLKPFWEVHKYHHSATSFNLITTARGHFIEAGAFSLFNALLFALIGAPPELYAALYAIREIWALWLHSNVEIRLGWVGKNILVTPAAHWVHHSKEERHYDKNFGTFFVFWDRMFGTYHIPEKVREIGINNDPYNQKGFWRDMFIGVRLFVKSVLAPK